MKCGRCPMPGPCYGEGPLPSLCALPLDRDHVIRDRHAFPPPGEPPSLLSRAVGFVKALAGHAAAGLPEASPELYEARVETCRACERFRPETGQCGVCGCLVVAVKARWRDTRCPLAKWPGEASSPILAAPADLATPGFKAGVENSEE